MRLQTKKKKKMMLHVYELDSLNLIQKDYPKDIESLLVY